MNVHMFHFYVQLTDAIKHSLDQTGGLPGDGPLGLDMYLSDTQGNQHINSKTVPSVRGTVPVAPGIYCSDGDSYESCLETIGGDEGDNASEIYTDTVDAFDHSDVKYLNTWL